MIIINWLIHFLGGFTKEEFTLLNKEYENQRALGIQSRAREEFLTNELKLEREERKILQDLIFKKCGVITPDNLNDAPPESLQPVSNGSQRWSNLKVRLEKDDLQRMKNNGQD